MHEYSLAQMRAEARVFAGLNRALAVTIAVCSMLFKASPASSIDSINDCKSGLAALFAPGGIFFKLGWEKSSHSPLHAPEVGKFLDSLAKMKVHAGLTAYKADHIPFWTAMQASLAMLKNVQALLENGNVVRGREALMAWCVNAISFEWFLRGATTMSIDLSNIEVIFGSGPPDSFPVCVAVDLTGKNKVDRRHAITRGRDFERVRASPCRAAALYFCSMTGTSHTLRYLRCFRSLAAEVRNASETEECASRCAAQLVHPSRAQRELVL